MSRLYDTVEPSVISDEMLLKAVQEQQCKEIAGQLAKEDGLEFMHVTELKLDFRNILKIDHLWCFFRLTKLQLDNNIIEKIEGLDCLVNLIWLDLSFNNIEMIEGLDRLSKLEDLTLYNNRIQRLENMDQLEQLHVLSVGNNNLDQLNNLKYLRRFKKLQTLNLSGNPLCQLEEYKRFVCGHLAQLEYLDYRLIDKKLRQRAIEQYDISIQELQSEESVAQVRKSDLDSKQHELQLHEKAYVENLNGPYLFDSMYLGDTEGEELAKIPGLQELKDSESFVALCQQLFNIGLQKSEERTLEIEDFLASIDEAKKSNRELAGVKLDEFNKYKDKVWRDLSECLDQSTIEIEVVEYKRKIGDLWDALMDLEMQLADQVDDTVDFFERSLTELVGVFLESVRGLVAQLREMENQYNERLTELATATMEKLNRNELDDDVTDALRDLFIDKDMVVNTIAASHDTHLLKIDNREDVLSSKIQRWLSALIFETSEREVVQRNRMRVTEINHIIDHLRDEIDSFDFTVPN